MDNEQYVIRLGKCTGLVFYASYRYYEKQGTYEELLNEYKKAQRHNKLFGWWFGLSPFVNTRYIKENKKSISDLQEIRRQQGLPT